MSPSRLDKAAAVIAMGIFGANQKGWKKQRTLVTGLLVGVWGCDGVVGFIVTRAKSVSVTSDRSFRWRVCFFQLQLHRVEGNRN